MDWHTIIREYNKDYLQSHRAEMEWFSNQPTLSATIKKAAFAQDHRGKRYSHQCRITKLALETSFQKLSAIEEKILLTGSFDELHQIIELTVTNVKGIGELYCYDTALRIGFKLNLEPKKVLLHAGTRVGASLIASIRGRMCLTKDDLPVELRELPAAQVEDIFCIYKGEIREMIFKIAANDAHGCRAPQKNPRTTISGFGTGIHKKGC